MTTARASGGWLVIAVLAAVASAIVVGESASRADLDNQLFTSKPDRLSLIVPRGWRASDAPTYPGVLLWMLRSQPPGEIAFTAEPFTHAAYCSWPAQCRASHDPLINKYACAIRVKLAPLNVHMGPIQAGPRENAESGMPSVWFEFDDGHRFLRQAVALSSDREVSLLLSTSSTDARSAHVRAFEQSLRTLHEIPAEVAAAAAEVAADASTVDAAPQVLQDGGVIDGNGAMPDGALPPADASPRDGGPVFSTAPVTVESPVGPCS